MTAYEIFRLVAPEFESEEESKILAYMDLYKDQISKKRFGASYDKALAFLTAHKMKMLGMGADNGIGTIADSLRVTSFSEGETSISFSTGQSTNLQVDADYALTTYGIEFLALKRNCIIPIVSAGEAISW